MSASLIIALAACGVWAYLLASRGGFWRASERDDRGAPETARSAAWPSVVAVIPARNEIETVGVCIGSLSSQRYPGSFAVVLIDDQSDDGTLDAAGKAAMTAGAAQRLSLVRGAPLPVGWTGKLWAIAQGIAHAEAHGQLPDYWLLTDADIVHTADAVAELVARARDRGLLLTSLMAELRCESAAERALVPAFVFFFQKLYPFAWVNRTDRKTAAAAGGCMLVSRVALQSIGGIAALRDELIDDCALARRLKARGPIWLGLTRRAHSLRGYDRIGDIRRLVARTAYAQLRYSPWVLAATTLAMTITYLAPPALALFGVGATRLAAIAAWAAMALAFQPTLKFYRRSPLWGPALPAIAAAYLLFTIDSAWQHWRGRGGLWKGRAQALRPTLR